MYLCKNCGLQKIAIRKWELCNKCYKTLRGNKDLYKFDAKKFKTRLSNKYGAEILKDFNALFYKAFWNLSDIASKYKLTRERTRQIYNILYNDPWIDIKKKKTDAVKEDINSLGGMCNPINRIACGNKKSHVFTGAIGELKVMKIAQKHGLSVKTTKTVAFDLLISGIPVEVKYTTKIFKPKDCKHKGYCRFGTQNNPKNSIYTAMLLGPTEEIYIVPSELLQTKTTYIRVDGKNKKFSEYLNRWDLLTR